MSIATKQIIGVVLLACGGFCVILHIAFANDHLQKLVDQLPPEKQFDPFDIRNTFKLEQELGFFGFLKQPFPLKAVTFLFTGVLLEIIGLSLLFPG